MKVLISHDVDHMTYWEHTSDLILPKHIVRSWLEVAKGKVGVGELIQRHKELLQNQWQHIEEVIEFNSSLGIKSSFFVGVNNGVGLNYPLKYAKTWIPKIAASGFEVGIHGISYDSYEGIKKEYDLFKEISGLENFGIRMHYLRQNESTFTNLGKAGYKYDATQYGFKNPYHDGTFWNFPLQIMDGWVLNGNKPYQIRNLEECKAYTLDELRKAKEAKLYYVNILFHDCYFSDGFATWKNWYIWIMKHLKEEGYEFLTYSEAISELESEK